ncbi:MAG TPA: histidinol-phosphatase [Spirochaetia bacterium]|nr:histidinol-phosphatase [Spirochaetia bacterium]
MHDYHVHTHYCRHATGRLEEYARAARRRGLAEICFTPHIPLPVFRPGAYDGQLRMDPEEFPRFLREVEETRVRVPGLVILAGVEADYVAGTEPYLEKFLSDYPLDFVLMSVHFVREWPDPRWVFDFSGDERPLARIYDDYLAAVHRGVQTALFDCVAHLDLIKQPGFPLEETHAEKIDAIIRDCLRRGMSAEVNMSGARKPIGEPYPSDAIVARMRSLGLPLVPASDAHSPPQVGSGLDSLEGFPLVRYRQRRMVDARLDALPAAGA